ncbi:MAG: response regulator transcription factor [Dehalococcoidia bacterium]|nr:response regulator transcription factor [Dehalococcoidia bacterium]
MTTIIAVDDDPSIRALVEATLAPEGYRVLCVSNGNEALSVARECDPDIVLLDIFMPDTDGYTLMRELREVTEAPVVFLTGFAGEYEVARGLESGTEDYVTKPFSPPFLLAKLKAILRRHRASDNSAIED